MTRKTKPANTKKAPNRNSSGASKVKTMQSKPAARSSADKSRKKKPPTVHKLVWNEVVCRVRHTRDYIDEGWSHVELIVLSPKDAPLPITQTGYLSHFIDEDDLAEAGGPVKFFLDWIVREGRTATWAKADFKWRQLELFAK